MSDPFRRFYGRGSINENNTVNKINRNIFEHFLHY